MDDEAHDFLCPMCKEDIQGKVIWTRKDPDVIYRKRECEKCGTRFYTKEVFSHFVKNYKKNGSQVPN